MLYDIVAIRTNKWRGCSTKVFWLAGHGTVANVNLRHDDAEQEKDADIPMNNFFKELSMNSLPRLSWKPEACAHTL